MRSAFTTRPAAMRSSASSAPPAASSNAGMVTSSACQPPSARSCSPTEPESKVAIKPGTRAAAVKAWRQATGLRLWGIALEAPTPFTGADSSISPISTCESSETSRASLPTLVTTSVGKLARDVSLLSQVEIGEMLESAPVKGVGGSSAMPHKRNPVACLQALTAAARVPGLIAILVAGSVGEHERALGGWQAELVTIPDVLDAAGGALDALEHIAAGLVVDAERMKANLESLRGLVFSERLARVIARETDRASAQALVDDWSARVVKERLHLKDVATAARPSQASEIAGVFSLETIVTELGPVLEETLAGIPAGA